MNELSSIEVNIDNNKECRGKEGTITKKFINEAI
jgi:hypothetical protein